MNVDKNAVYPLLITLKPMNNYHQTSQPAGGVFEQASGARSPKHLRATDKLGMGFCSFG